VRFHVAQQHGLSNARSPFRVVEQSGREVEWVNRYLDQQRVRGVAGSTLRSYAHDLLHFLRWWATAHKTSSISKDALTESTFLDYIRFQVNQSPPPAAESINRRVGTAERAMRREFPEAAPSVCARLSELVLAAIAAWLRAATPGADSVAGKDAQTLDRAIVGR
jgi:hypothetical protein